MHISLRRASDQLLADMVESIFYLMNKYPEIGKPNDQSQDVEAITSGADNE